MTSDITKEYYDNEWERTLDSYEVRNRFTENVQKELEILPELNEKFSNGEYNNLTKIYYDSISDNLQNNLQLYYNGALIIDLDSDPKTFIDQDVDNIIKYSKMDDNDSVLECGCGSGYFFKRLIQKKPDLKYKGIDLSTNQIENAKYLNKDYPRKFKQCDWNNIEYSDESFDIILFLETIGYARDIDQLLDECYRVLKPGGKLFSKHPGCIREEYHLITQIDENIKALNTEYGYDGTSLGMMMNVPYFIKKLEEHGFSVPEGAIVPPRDESLYIKSHFIEEVHSCFETIKVGNAFVSIRYPDGDPQKFWERVYNVNPELQPSTILSGLGKMHPRLVNFFKQTTFVEKHADDEYSVYRSGQQIMSPCVLVTAFKK
jgi:ubiquinone/menaquinone biosynthesis C-methylase UbiE